MYVDNMIQQLLKIDETFSNNIVIVNNCSTNSNTIEFLNNTKLKVINRKENIGPRIMSDIYDTLPEHFIWTDPDLELNGNLPKNFIEIMIDLSEKYNASKIGFALDIGDYDKMFNLTYHEGKTIYDWESQFWRNRITDNIEYELYNVVIDTTFFLCNKKYYIDNLSGKHIRIAGNFTAKHLPWYIDNKIYNKYDNYMNAKLQTKISTTSNVIISYTEKNYIILNKNDEKIIISKDDYNFLFWRDIYQNWENDTFDVFDKFLDKTKIFIDIGCWVGTTSIYGSRKSKYVYAIDADKKSIEDVSKNMYNNCEKNYTIINKALYHKNDIDIKFGVNRFRDAATLNDSTSQIYPDETANINNEGQFYSIKTITIRNLIHDYNIDMNNVSLIKVDIEGGEEYILQDLFELGIPTYVSFHYSWWQNNDLDRFHFLTEEHKKLIKQEPFTSILFHA